MLTLSSVHWADKATATNSSNGVEKLRVHTAFGYSFFNKSIIFIICFFP